MATARFTRARARALSQTRSSLRQQVDAKWETLLQHGYGCSPAPPLSREQARALAIDLVDALQEPELLRQLDESRTGARRERGSAPRARGL